MVVLLPFQSGIRLFKRCFHRIVQNEIWMKYTGQHEEHGCLLKWIRQLGYSTEFSTRRFTFGENISLMAKKQTTTTKAEESFETHKNYQIR